MTWSGDISGMGQLAQRVADLGQVPSRAAKAIAAELGDLIEEEFEAGADPYGTAWAPLTEATLAKRSQTSEPPLTDFGAMRRSVQVKPLARAGVGITIAHPAAPHQTGWVGPQGSGPARSVLPSGAMPERWAEVIEVEVSEAFKRSA